jgi:hypothetical protein
VQDIGVGFAVQDALQGGKVDGGCVVVGHGTDQGFQSVE